MSLDSRESPSQGLQVPGTLSSFSSAHKSYWAPQFFDSTKLPLIHRGHIGPYV
jgi:hypothetical protein